MIELGIFVLYAPFAIGAIFLVLSLVPTVVEFASPAVMLVLEALGRALLALALTLRLWRAARARTLYPPTPPPRGQSLAFRWGRWIAGHPWLFALGYLAATVALIIVHRP